MTPELEQQMRDDLSFFDSLRAITGVLTSTEAMALSGLTRPAVHGAWKRGAFMARRAGSTLIIDRNSFELWLEMRKNG